MWIIFAFIMPVLFVASLLTTFRWGLSVKRSNTIIILSLVFAIAGVGAGAQYMITSDRSGDGSAIFAAFWGGLLFYGPLFGMVFFWLAVGFSKALGRGGHH